MSEEVDGEGDGELDAIMLAMEEDQTDAPSVGPGFDKLNSFVKRQVLLENRKEQLEEMLKKTNADLEAAKRSTAEAMNEARVPKFETEEGDKVSVQTVYFTSVKKENLPAFYNWLEDNERGGVIDASVVIPLGKGGWAEANKIAESVRVKGYVPTGLTLDILPQGSIHWGTLRALGHELSDELEKEDGQIDLPDYVKINPVAMAKIRRSK